MLITSSGLRKAAESPKASGSSIDRLYSTDLKRSLQYVHIPISVAQTSIGYNRILDMIAFRAAGLCGITLILANRAVRTLSYRGGPGSDSLLLSPACSFTHCGMVLRFVPASTGSHPQVPSLNVSRG